MTRVDFARWLRDQANAFNLPLEDGDLLTEEDRRRSRWLKKYLECFAAEVESENECDADAIADLGIEANAD